MCSMNFILYSPLRTIISPLFKSNLSKVRLRHQSMGVGSYLHPENPAFFFFLEPLALAAAT